MSDVRTKCLSTKLTETEYAALERAAGARTLSVWARAVLLDAAAWTPPEREGDARLATPDLPDVPRADARRDDAAGGRLGLPSKGGVGPPANDRIALATVRSSYDPTSLVQWRPRSTDWPSWNPNPTAYRMLTRPRVWLLAMLVLACLAAGATAAYRYARIWTPLQRQFDLVRPSLWWGALAVLVVALVMAFADLIACRVSRRAAQSPWDRFAPESNRAGAGRRPWSIARRSRRYRC
jgi:hypothetical protein